MSKALVSNHESGWNLTLGAPSDGGDNLVWTGLLQPEQEVSVAAETIIDGALFTPLTKLRRSRNAAKTPQTTSTPYWTPHGDSTYMEGHHPT
jgi:hypothetical protein